MSKKGKKAVNEPKKMTKRQLSKYERDRKMNRILQIAAAAVTVIVVLILAVGYFSEVLNKPNEAVAKVNGTNITLGDYAKLLGYEGLNLDMQKAQLQALASGAGSSGGDQNSLQQIVQQQLQQIDFQKQYLPDQLLDNMIDDELVRQEAARRNITVSPQEVDDEIMKELAPPSSAAATDSSAPADPTDAANATPTGDQTQTAAQPTPEPKTIGQVTDDLRRLLDQGGFLSVDEYRHSIVEPTVLRDKLGKVFGDETPTTAEQVHVRQIQVDTEDQAKEVLRLLNDEKQDFATVAQQMSKDTVTKDNGGDLGWFPSGVKSQALSDAAFNMQPGQLSDPIQLGSSYYIIQLVERANDYPLSDQYLSQFKANALTKWLTDQKSPDAGKVDYLMSVETEKWANDYVLAKNKEMVKRQQAAQNAQK